MTRYRMTWAAAGLGALTLGWLLFGGRRPAQPARGTSPTPEVTVAASRTPGPSASPFLPSGTATPEPPPQATATSATPWAGWPTPVYPFSLTPVPYPVLPPAGAEGVRAFLVLGSDFMPHRDSVNTDVVALVLLWTDEAGSNHASIVSLPRDLYVFVPGWGMARINAAYANAGPEAALDAVAYNFGVRPGNYALLDMGAFVRFIDYLGGVEIEAETAFGADCGDFFLAMDAGRTTLDGLSALCYARSRENSSDFDRLRREQEIMAGVFRAVSARALSDPAGTAWVMFTEFQNLVRTDASVGDAMTVAVFSAFIPEGNLHYYRLVPPLVTRWTKPDSGAYLLIPPPPGCLRDLLARSLRGLPWLALADFEGCDWPAFP